MIASALVLFLLPVGFRMSASNIAQPTEILYIGDSLSVGVKGNAVDYLGPRVFQRLVEGRDLERSYPAAIHAFGGARPTDWFWESGLADGILYRPPQLYSHRFTVSEIVDNETWWSSDKFNGSLLMPLTLPRLLDGLSESGSVDIDIPHYDSRRDLDPYRGIIDQLPNLALNPRAVIVQLGTNLLGLLSQGDGQLLEASEKRTGAENEIRSQVERLVRQIRHGDRLCYWILPPHAREDVYSMELQKNLQRLILEGIQGRCLVYDSLSKPWLRMNHRDHDALHYDLRRSNLWGDDVLLELNQVFLPLLD